MNFNQTKFDEITNKLWGDNDARGYRELGYAEGKRDGFREGVIAIIKAIMDNSTGILEDVKKEAKNGRDKD